jgi:hypothetical protein
MRWKPTQEMLGRRGKGEVSRSEKMEEEGREEEKG